MSARPEPAAGECRLKARAPEPMLEFAAFGFPLGRAFVVGWPTAHGAVRHDKDGRPVLLHFAPTRWLVPSPHPDVTPFITAAIEAGAGVIIGVDGKWQALELTGAGARRVLASTIDVEQALDGRECAAVTLFDCPAILARIPAGFAIWVRSSYAADFAAAVAAVSPGR